VTHPFLGAGDVEKSIKRSGIHRKGEVSLSELLNSVRSNPGFHKAGAIGVFIGVVRGEAPDGSRVERLELEAYEEEAEKALEKICRDLMGREGIVDVRIHHIVGTFNVGEDLVYVVVAGSHRDEVFSTLREAVERYKKEALIFKREFTVDEKGVRRSFWVGEGVRIPADEPDDKPQGV